ncbi:hypothetical protein A2_00110 [Pseudomonas phage BIM BV-45]|nr:hypothetical protein A2_00110 [Pseudomonas phage BIM BV-45]
MSRVSIILSQPGRGEALRALTKLGKHPGDSFVGPVFEDAKVAMKDGFVHVVVEGVTYSYPAHTVMRVKTEN